MRRRLRNCQADLQMTKSNFIDKGFPSAPLAANRMLYAARVCNVDVKLKYDLKLNSAENMK